MVVRGSYDTPLLGTVKDEVCGTVSDESLVKPAGVYNLNDCVGSSTACFWASSPAYPRGLHLLRAAIITILSCQS